MVPPPKESEINLDNITYPLSSRTGKLYSQTLYFKSRKLTA